MDAQQRLILQRALTRLADGDRSAFHPVFELVWPVARAYATRLTSAPADGEDAAQAALLKIFERASAFDPTRDALAWCIGIVGFECLTLRRRRQRRREVGDAAASELATSATPESEVLRAELYALAASTLGSLRAEDRATLDAAFAGDQPPHVPPATFRKRLERALGRLRVAWRQHGIG